MLKASIVIISSASLLFGTSCTQNSLTPSSEVKIRNGDLPSASQNDARNRGIVALTTPERSEKGHTICSGPILNRKVILTAAHCIVDDQGNSRGVELWVSWGNKISPNRLVKVKEAIPHPDYNVNSWNFASHDIAVLILEESLPSDLQPVPLAQQEPDIGRETYASGYGLSVDAHEASEDELPNYTGTLYQTEGKMVRKARKINFPHLVSENKGSQSCSGDSGGPLFVKNNGQFEVAGLLSFVELDSDDERSRCGRDGHYTYPGLYFDWIEEQASKAGDVGPAPKPRPEPEPDPIEPDPVPEDPEPVPLPDPGVTFAPVECPFGYELKPVNSAGGRLCSNGKDAWGPFSEKMIQRCINDWNGGEQICGTNRWSWTIAKDTFGKGVCPEGASFEEDLGYCVENGMAFGPFPQELKEVCFESNEKLVCYQPKWSVDVLRGVLGK